MRAYKPKDRVLIDLDDQRTDLAIRIGLIKTSDQPDLTELLKLRRELELLDHRIAAHEAGPGAEATADRRATGDYPRPAPPRRACND